MPIFYDCDRCTACCRWPGQVKLTEEEISRLAAAMKIAEQEFIDQFTQLRHDRMGLTLKNKEDGSCIFLEGSDCVVHPTKPQQCRDFPNLWNFPGFQQICSAKARIVGDREYARLLREATGREAIRQ